MGLLQLKSNTRGERSSPRKTKGTTPKMLTEEDKAWILERLATKEQLERVETALLTEFHKWASPIDARLKSHMATLRALDVEMEAISERVTKLESPKN
jgi:transposase